MTIAISVESIVPNQMQPGMYINDPMWNISICVLDADRLMRWLFMQVWLN